MSSAAERPIRVIQMGLGPIGQRTVAYLAERNGIELVGAIDIDPDKQGQDVGVLSGTESLGVQVEAEAEAVLQREADVVLLTTSSQFTQLKSQLESCIKAGKSVVSTCEELAFPFETDPELAVHIDQLAREHQVAVLGTGVNPGFLMDALPIFLTSVCRQVDRVLVERFQDASIRRLPFQQKIGAGLTPEEFEEKLQSGKIRHVGFSESIRMIAGALGWKLDKVEDIVAPVIAEKATGSQFIQVEVGQCAGLRQLGYGYLNGEQVITLELQAYLGHPEPRDTVTVYGDPEIHSNIAGGVNGDVATCSMVLNALQAVQNAAPGLRTMADVPLTHWYGQR